MFEVGFSEIVLIMLIALVVLGPEKLPKLAADVGRWMGRARSMARQLRSQLDQEVQLDDMLRDKPATPPPAYPPPNQASGGYGAAPATATTTAADATSVAGAGAGAAADSSAALDATDPVSAMHDTPTSREAAYAAHVAQTQAAYHNPPAAGPGAPEIGAPTDDLHSHGPPPADVPTEPRSAMAPPRTAAPDSTDADRAHGPRHT